MDPDPVANPTQIMWKYYSFQKYCISKYFISIQTEKNLVINKKNVYNAQDIEFGVGGDHTSHTHSISQVLQLTTWV